MMTSRSNFAAVTFFIYGFFCVWNPDFLPARDWLNHGLEMAFGWAR